MSIFNNNRWIKIAILLLLIANAATLVLLWTNRPPAHDRPAREGGPFEFISKELGLNAEQKVAYANLRDEHRSAADKLQDSIRAAKDRFFGLLKNNQVDDSTLAICSHAIGEKETALDLLTFRHFRQLRKLCDPGQQQKFDAIIQDAIRNMKGPKGPPPHPH